MKSKIKIVASAFLCFIIVFSFSTNAYGQSLGTFDEKYNTHLYSDSYGTYFVAYKDTTLNVSKILPVSDEYELSFDGKILSICFENGKIYVLTKHMYQNNVYICYAVEKSDITWEVAITGITLSRNFAWAVDKNNLIYIKDINESIRIIDSNGRILRSLSISVGNLFNCNGNVYCSAYDGISMLSKDGYRKISNVSCTCDLISISDKYVADVRGNIYKVSDGFRNILNVNRGNMPNAGETDKYIVSFRGNNLTAYDKYSGEFIANYKANKSPYYLTAFKNNICIVTKSNNRYSYETFDADKIFKIEETDSHDSNNISSDNKQVLSFGKFRIKGKYIVIPSGTTASKFKKSIVYNGYDTEFSKKNGKLGTGEKVLFKNGDLVKSYIFIVMGDITGEGNINSRDVSLMFKYLLGEKDIGRHFKFAADMNGDGEISNIDLVMLDKLYSTKKLSD